ncbi:TonB-dependent siderophore receptor [Prevotella sp. MA2016]|uniref:TonB-dependent receptor plug domain-containing protein n=1 Tax=Prevotella sp. MA2016 TaxID=1408310 RepID=UPI00048BFA76|nr:TonB-dependent receptor [Prevotella sp. MA2016]
MYKQTFNMKRQRLIFRQFGNKGYSLFSCLGREVVCSVLSVSTLTYASAESVSTKPLVNDSTAMTTAREMMLDEVSVTGSRAPLTKSQAARMVTVLDRQQIAQAPVQSVNDLLKYAVGVDVRQRGALGAQTDISIRGGNNEQITILLNGVNICDPQTGHNAFDLPVDINDIVRIEVLEGPAGRVYGTSSLVGAINIVTRADAGTGNEGAQLHAEAGSYGYANVGGRVALDGKTSQSLSANYTRSDGFSRNKAGGLNADYKTVKAFYQGRYSDEQMRVDWHAGLSVKDFGSNTFYGAKWDDQFEHTLKTYTAISAENKQGRLHLKPTIYWNRSMDRFELFRDAPDTYPFNYHRTDVYGVNLNGHFDWTLGRTAIGAELRNEDLVSGNLGEPLANVHHIHGTNRNYEYGLNRTNISFVLEHNILLKQFTLSAGLVAVKNSWNEMNMRLYPGIDASYRIGNNWKLYASYNTSLRMPSVTELYYSVGGHKADKHLKPEELAAWEGGVKYNSYDLEGSVSVYRNHCKNLIDWIRRSDDPDAPWESVNFTEVNATGIEANLALNLQELLPAQHLLKKLSVAYSYIDQDKVETDGIQSQYTLEYLRHKLVAQLQANLWKQLNMNIYYRLQDRTGTYTNADGQIKDYEPYGVVDARLSWNAPRYTLYVEANNLLDKRYVEYGHVEQPGRWLIAGINITL